MGILAGVHPCGTITLLGELFGAESKEQVYGHLHAFFCDNEMFTSDISKCTYGYSLQIFPIDVYHNFL